MKLKVCDFSFEDLTVGKDVYISHYSLTGINSNDVIRIYYLKENKESYLDVYNYIIRLMATESAETKLIIGGFIKNEIDTWEHITLNFK